MKNEYKAPSPRQFHSRDRETDINLDQNIKSKLFLRGNSDDEEVTNKNKVPNSQYRQRFQPTTSRYQTTDNQNIEQQSKQNQSADKEKSENDNPRERKYSSVKRFDYKSLNRKRPSAFVTTEKTVDPDFSILNQQRNKDFNEDKEVANDAEENLLANEVPGKKIQLLDEPKAEYTSEIPTSEGGNVKTKLQKSYVPRNRALEYNKFRARTENTADSITAPTTPIIPNYKLYNRNDGTNFRRRSFTTPTAEGNFVKCIHFKTLSLYTGIVAYISTYKFIKRNQYLLLGLLLFKKKKIQFFTGKNRLGLKIIFDAD